MIFYAPFLQKRGQLLHDQLSNGRITVYKMSFRASLAASLWEAEAHRVATSQRESIMNILSIILV